MRLRRGVMMQYCVNSPQNVQRFANGEKFNSPTSHLLTALLWISVVTDEDFLARGPEQRRPVDGVIEAQAAVVEDVDVPGADLTQRLELERGDPALLQDQKRNATSTERDERAEGEMSGREERRGRGRRG